MRLGLNRCLLVPLIALSPAVTAMPYFGLQYGQASIDSGYATDFHQSANCAAIVTVKPDGSEDIFGGFVGYQLSDNLSLELGYNYFNADDSHDREQGLVNFQFSGQSTKQPAKHESEWEAELKAHQLALKSVYLSPLVGPLNLKTGLGVTLTKYKYRASAYDEYESVANDDLEVRIARTSGESKKDDAVGGIVSIGLTYIAHRNFRVGADIEYQFDRIANTTRVMLGASYHF